jgi:hypothetical protein
MDDMLSLDMPIPIREREELLRAQPVAKPHPSANPRAAEPEPGGEN